MPRPLHDRVWLLFPEDCYRNEGGVIVKESAESRLDATVVAVGPEVPEGALGVGDRVVASMFDGLPVDHEGCRYRSVPFSSILAVIE